MTAKQYRTHQGRMLDIGALVLKNERIKAVGNMNVNARGDRVDADNRPIDTKPQQVNRQYRRQTTNVQDTPVLQPLAETTPQAQPRPTAKAAEPKVTQPETSAQSGTIQGGLAAAIAKAQKSAKPENA